MARQPEQAEPEEVEQEAEDEEGLVDDHVLIAVIVLLLAGLAIEEFTRRLTLLFAPLAIPAEATIAAVQLLHGAGGLVLTLPPPPAGPAGAVAVMQRGQVARRAMFLLASARRLAGDSTVDAERALYRAHLRAEDKRVASAQQIDAAARKYGPVLGWKARLDDRTTAECRRAHGSNFSALRPPLLGWPGTRHAGNCRCEAVAPCRRA